MFKIESYVTPILLSYVDKYVKDFKPADAQVSLWGGGVLLHNLVLKTDVLQNEISLPFSLLSGRIHELLIQVPWTKIMSEPIVVTIDTIECVLGNSTDISPHKAETTDSSRKSQEVEAPPGYMQALVRRIVSNISVNIQHLILKYVDDDIVLSLNIKQLSVQSAGPDWNPAFADIDQTNPVIRRLIDIDDLTLCLDRADADGKIRFFQEPLLYRCQLQLKLLTNLISPAALRAKSLHIQLRSSKLAWSITNEQLNLVLRLLNSQAARANKARRATPPEPVKARPAPSAPPAPSHVTAATTDSPAETWTEWAWSWFPTAAENQESLTLPAPTPLQVAVFLDDITLVYKIMEMDAGKKKARSVLELIARYVALEGFICQPTRISVAFGVRSIVLQSTGKCPCGMNEEYNIKNDPCVYISKINETDPSFTWPEPLLEVGRVSNDYQREPNSEEFVLQLHMPTTTSEALMMPGEYLNSSTSRPCTIWAAIEPVFQIEFNHERSPPANLTNPYENVPTDFEYSGWTEDVSLRVQLQKLYINIPTALLHRLQTITESLTFPPTTSPTLLPPPTLTMEECEELTENLPQMRISFEWVEPAIQIPQYGHDTDRTVSLKIAAPVFSALIITPLYPSRVCAAACQLPKQEGVIWNGARMHVTLFLSSLQVLVADDVTAIAKPVARVDMRLVLHKLLEKQHFKMRQTMMDSYALNIKEFHVCGSAPRLKTAVYILKSIQEKQISVVLKNTSLARDAFADEDSVALDFTAEELTLRGYVTQSISAHSLVLQSARSTALLSKDGKETRQAWIFNAPDVFTTAPFLRINFQHCTEPMSTDLDYFGMWAEPAAILFDPLLVAWLSYKPTYTPFVQEETEVPVNLSKSSSINLRRRPSAQQSSTRLKTHSVAEMIHSPRPRSMTSSSERSECKKATSNTTTKSDNNWFDPDALLSLYGRLRYMLLNVELGLIVFYITNNTVSAVDCITLRESIDKHAEPTFALGLGSVWLHSNTVTKQLWQEVKQEGPTYFTSNIRVNTKDDMFFPWKLRIADLTCYTLDSTNTSTHDQLPTGTKAAGLQSSVFNMLNMLTTTITLSVVTKSMAAKIVKNEKKRGSPAIDERMKYFTAGPDFKPQNLKEFLRGPSRKQPAEKAPATNRPSVPELQGPIVSIGVCLHADTPPIMFKIKNNQVSVMAMAIHGIKHIVAAVQQPIMPSPSDDLSQTSATRFSEDTADTPSETKSEMLISIFEPIPEPVFKLKTSFWFQWVINRISIVYVIDDLKLALSIDDVIFTIDLQSQYSQFKLKVSSASIKHYQRDKTNAWHPGMLGGRIVEGIEAQEMGRDGNFLSVTITSAQISSLPATWKEELNPKLLHGKEVVDELWEIYVTLSPIECILRPYIITEISKALNDMAPKYECLPIVAQKPRANENLPFCYLHSGGVRVLFAPEFQRCKEDTLMFSIGQIIINPHPDNPICRRPVQVSDGTWLTLGSGFQGRQYEIVMKRITIHFLQFAQLINKEESESVHRALENPAVKWTQQMPKATMTTALNNVEISCVLAPAHKASSSMGYAPAVEVNITSDCSLELGVCHMDLISELVLGYTTAFSKMDDLGKLCTYRAMMKSEPTTFQKPATSTSEYGADSGVDMQSTDSHVHKKSANTEFGSVLAHHFELYVIFGIVGLSLYVYDNKNTSVLDLVQTPATEFEIVKNPSSIHHPPRSEDDETIDDPKDASEEGSKMENDKTEEAEARLDLTAKTKMPKIYLLNFIMQQPNLYYFMMPTQNTLQASLFDLSVNLGSSDSDKSQWNLLSTAPGVADLVTDVPPALCTLKIVTPPEDLKTANKFHNKGSARFDVARPITVEVSEARKRHLEVIIELIQVFQSKWKTNQNQKVNLETKDKDPLCALRESLVNASIECITVNLTQFGIVGADGSIGWDSLCMQLVNWPRPKKIVLKSLATSVIASVGPSHERRHLLMNPLNIGFTVSAEWVNWCSDEENVPSNPLIKILLDLDHIVLSLRPADLLLAKRLQEIFQSDKTKGTKPKVFTRTKNYTKCQTPNYIDTDSDETKDKSEHYYKDDLRSGAFKLIYCDLLPTAYEIKLNENSISWGYPQPRSVTSITAYPLPNQDDPLNCVLEYYNSVALHWEEYASFTISCVDPIEVGVFIAPPDTVFAYIWRCRIKAGKEDTSTSYNHIFDHSKYTPKDNPLSTENYKGANVNYTYNVLLEQLAGALRVDSYFAPQYLPKTQVAVKISYVAVHLYNALRSMTSDLKNFDGYYVSKPLTKSHRALSLFLRNTSVFLQNNTICGKSLLFNTQLSVDIFNTDLGVMDSLLGNTMLQAAISMPDDTIEKAKMRFFVSVVQVGVYLSRVKTLQSLALDWVHAWKTNDAVLKLHEANQVYKGLEGWITIWINNETSSSLKVAQEGTDEVIPLGPGTSYSYRWRSSSAAKRLRFAMAGPSGGEWKWTNSMPLYPGTYKLTLPVQADANNDNQDELPLFATVHRNGLETNLNIAGRVILANMMRMPLQFKLRLRVDHNWQTLNSGELPPESLAQSIISPSGAQLGLKLKMTKHQSGWSGEIPLRACPKQNVPWLVKIPTGGSGGMPYLSVWCRVIRFNPTKRIIASIWPLYVAKSRLPLDVSILVKSSDDDTIEPMENTNMHHFTHRMEYINGRGGSCHIIAPGTTSTKHFISLQYKHVEVPIACQDIPLSYSLADISDFETKAPLTDVETLLTDILKWLQESENEPNSDWPYSCVTKHTYGQWLPTLSQPRSDIKVTHNVVHAGGACTFRIEFSPVVLFCNAAPLTLTLRAHDALPICELYPQTAISASVSLVEKSFYLSLEVSKGVYVSSELSICSQDPGRYGSPPPNSVAIDHPASIAIQCNQNVALLSLFYEIKNDINLIGVSATYFVVNTLSHSILVAPIVVSRASSDVLLRPAVFFAVSPVQESMAGEHGVPICKFFNHDRSVVGGHVDELRPYFCLALACDSNHLTDDAVPLLLEGESRRSVGLKRFNKASAVVVTQQRLEGRWLLTVGADPCPQFCIHNQTNKTVAIAEAMEDDSSGTVQAARESDGVIWSCSIEPDSQMYYSTPSYCAQFPKINKTDDTVRSTPALTFALVFYSQPTDDMDSSPLFNALEWSSKVVIEQGEQLIKFSNGATVKLIIYPHFHSTLLELQDVQEGDLLARNIRDRLSRQLPEPCAEQVQSVPISNHRSETELPPPHSSTHIGRPSPVRIEPSLGTVFPTIENASDQEDTPVKPKEKLKGPSPCRQNEEAELTESDSASAEPIREDDLVQWIRSMRFIQQEDQAASLSAASVAKPENWWNYEQVRGCVQGVTLEFSSTADVAPLLVAHFDGIHVKMCTDNTGYSTTVLFKEVQVENKQYETEEYDFAVIASTGNTLLSREPFPPLWTMFLDTPVDPNSHFTLQLRHEKWKLLDGNRIVLCDLRVGLGPLSLYIEDAYIKELVNLVKLLFPEVEEDETTVVLEEAVSFQRPLRLRTFHMEPLDLTLTLRTSVRMYIALDQSPIQLTAFHLDDMMTTTERLLQSLTVHYLSAVIMGVGWVVGGLELLGAPGAIAARVGGATGGVRGVATAAAAAVVRSLSAWASSLARNLDLLAGDEDYSRRAAAARRRPPQNIASALYIGLTNFAVNVLGAVGGLAHHPLLGVAAGETSSRVTALRRGLVGAVAKPLSATADLVAFAGNGLLTQTGWDTTPTPRPQRVLNAETRLRSWDRNCVRWSFRMAEMSVVGGYEATIDNAQRLIILTFKTMVIVDALTEKIVEIIDLKFCTLESHNGSTIEMTVSQQRRRETRLSNEDDYQISMARVARYTGVDFSGRNVLRVHEERLLTLVTEPGLARTLYATLTTLLHENKDTHFHLL